MLGSWDYLTEQTEKKKKKKKKKKMNKIAQNFNFSIGYNFLLHGSIGFIFHIYNENNMLNINMHSKIVYLLSGVCYRDPVFASSGSTLL